MSVTRLKFGASRGTATAKRVGRVYAISFDLDTKVAQRLCGDNWRGTCYDKIEAVLREHGFTRMQGSLYFGTEQSDSVSCVLAVQDLDNRCAWFGRTVRDLRMFRIDENNNLLPALSTRLRFDDAADAA